MMSYLIFIILLITKIYNISKIINKENQALRILQIMKTKLLLIALFGVSLSACSHDVEVKSIDYYKSHLDEAQTKAKACKNLDQTNASIQLDCDNAVAAITSKMFDNGMKKAPAYGTTKINGF